MNATSVKCLDCGTKHALNEIVFFCSRCGGLLELEYDYEKIKNAINRSNLDTRKRRNLWRYSEVLPINTENMVTLGEGVTPLIKASSFERSRNVKHLHLKLEFLHPTGSFKDRGSSVLISKAKELRVKSVAIDSSGNAAASLSGYSAKAGLRCFVFTPAYASVSKLIQTINYGATVFAVEGTRRASYEIANKAYQNLGWYYCGFQTNPYALAGLKTIAYEICEQLNWNPPNWVVFPVGTGSMLVGCWRGFNELQEMGWISESPSLLCVQPEGCAPISNAFRNGAKEIRPVNKPASVAEGLLIGHPLRGKWILKALHDSNGWAETVSDVEITQTAKHLARSEGIFVEPSAAASLAGLIKAIEVGRINKNETIVSLLTGTGLKTQKFYSARVQKPLVIQPQIEDLKKALRANV